MYDDEVSADRFRLHFTMIKMCVLIGQSRLFHAHIVYEIAITKNTAEFCRIFYCLALFDTIEFNRLPFPNDKMCNDDVFVDRYRYQETMLEVGLLIGILRLLHDHIAPDIFM